MGIVQRRTFVRKYSTISTRLVVGLYLIDEKPTSFVDKRTKDRHTLESSQGGSRLMTDLAMLITRPMSLAPTNLQLEFVLREENPMGQKLHVKKSLWDKNFNKDLLVICPFTKWS